jgi:dTDP-glucose pyrophosphorylase
MNKLKVFTETQKLEELIIRGTATIMETLRVIDNGAEQIALFVSDDDRLDGVVTDGDIRRAILNGANLNGPVEPFIRRQFRSVRSNTKRTEALELMNCFGIKRLPIVDTDGKLTGLHLLERLIHPDVLPNAALVLAGGKGTRLGKLTEHTPKPMLKVAGRPILERIVLHLVGSGIRNVFLSVNHLAESIESHFGDGTNFGCQIIYVREDKPLGTGGCLGLLSNYSLQHPLVVMNGDLVTDFSVKGLIDTHTAESNAITVGVQSYTHKVPFGCIEVEGTRVTCLNEKPVYETLINAGIYVFSPSVLDTIIPDFMPITNLLAEAISDRKRVGVYEIQDWIDVGAPDELRKARGLG